MCLSESDGIQAQKQVGWGTWLQPTEMTRWKIAAADVYLAPDSACNSSETGPWGIDTEDLISG